MLLRHFAHLIFLIAASNVTAVDISAPNENEVLAEAAAVGLTSSEHSSHLRSRALSWTTSFYWTVTTTQSSFTVTWGCDEKKNTLCVMPDSASDNAFKACKKSNRVHRHVEDGNGQSGTCEHTVNNLDCNTKYVVLIDRSRPDWFGDNGVVKFTTDACGNGSGGFGGGTPGVFEIIDVETDPVGPGAKVTWECDSDKKWRGFVCSIEALEQGFSGPGCPKIFDEDDIDFLPNDECSWDMPNLECETEYYLQIKQGSWCWLSLGAHCKERTEYFTTGQCPCSDPNPCRLFDTATSYNAATNRCEMVTVNDAFKDDEIWYHEKNEIPGNDPFFCPVIDGVQTSVENPYECLTGTLPAGPPDRPGFVYGGAFYYAAIHNPPDDLCPYKPYTSSQPVNLMDDNGIPFIACLVANIPPAYEYFYVDGQKLLIKHLNICRDPTACLTSQLKNPWDGVYDPVKDACFIIDEANINARICGFIDGNDDLINPDICGGDQGFSYDSCVDLSLCRRHLATPRGAPTPSPYPAHSERKLVAPPPSNPPPAPSNPDPKEGIPVPGGYIFFPEKIGAPIISVDVIPWPYEQLEANKLLVGGMAEKILIRKCGGPPICPSLDPNIGTCTPCSSQGDALKLADIIYGSITNDEIRRQVETGALDLSSGQGVGPSDLDIADERLAERLAAGDFSGAVASLSTILSRPRWYPVEGTLTCKNDGNQPPHVESLGWLTATLESCCQKSFQWAFNACMNKGEPLESTKQYFADFESGSCLRDCEPGLTDFGCSEVPAPIALYDSIEACCAIAQSWVPPAYCVTRSAGDYSYGWAVDYDNKKCIQDCDPIADGPLCADSDFINRSTILFGTPDECCESMLAWEDLDTCFAESSTAEPYTEKFYVDWYGFKCAKDCDASNGLPCLGSPQYSSNELYDTAEACCEGKLGWVALDKCVADTDGVVLQALGTEEWYVDWFKAGTCVKNCIGGPLCGGLKSSWTPTFPSASACCDFLSWKPADKCHL